MLNKELQDLAWSLLPKEFKEEVKKMWDAETAWNVERVDLFCDLFGHHNLTSDAEGEEMLCVPRKKVEEKWQRAYEQEAKYSRAQDSPVVREELYYNRGILSILDTLFGSKCLPDELNEDNFAKSANEVNFATKEPKPAEPKFKKGDKARHHGNIVKIVEHDKNEGLFKVERSEIIAINDRPKASYASYWVKERDLEPYTEPKESSRQFYRIIGTNEHGIRVITPIPPEVAGPYDISEERTEPKEVAKMKPIESKVSVYLATKEEDEEFRMLLHENGFVWNMGASLISDSHWLSGSESSKMHYVYPDKTVTYYGDKTSDTLTFTEFKKRYFGEDVNLSQETANCDKQLENILKDSFSKERRLNIAAMAMQGIMANSNPQMVDMNVERVVDLAILTADTLIAECNSPIN